MTTGYNWDAPWLEQSAAPDTPATGRWKFFPKSDGFYSLDDAGSALRLLTSADLSITLGGFTTTATAAGTTTLTAASSRVQEFTGVTTQDVVLPDATTLVVGREFKIRNASTGAVTIKTNGGATLLTLAASQEVLLVCKTVATAAGTWSYQAVSGSGAYVLATSATLVTPAITGPITVTAGDATVNNYVYQLTLRNTLDTAPAPDDYGNEVHLRLQAGTAADHRAYLNFADYTGTDKWLTGRNAYNVWILYNTDTVHRFWFEPDSGTYSSGASYINAAGTGAVRINYHPTDDVSTAGLEVWAGGDHTSPTRLHILNADGYFHYLADGNLSGTQIDAEGNLSVKVAVPNTRYAVNVANTSTAVAGGSFGGVLALETYDPTGATVQTAYGGNFTLKTVGTYTFNTAVGGGFIAEHGSTGAMSILYGGLFSAQTTSGVAAPITSAIGGNFTVKNNGSGVIGNGYGIYIDTPLNGGGGSITTAYGLRIANQTIGTTNYAIRTGTGQNLLGDATTVKITDANTATAPITLISDHDLSSGTAGDGIGSEVSFRARSNNVASRNVAAIDGIFSTAADATRIGDLVFYVYNVATKREALRLRGGASDAQIGFLGATPVSLQSTYVQTYSTATLTVNPASTSAFTGIDNAQVGSVYAQVADLNTLRGDLLMAMQLINQLIDDGQAYGLAA